jgi:hypothetical protein
MDELEIKSPFQFIENRIVKLNIKNDTLSLSNDNIINELSKLDYQIVDLSETDNEYVGVLQISMLIRVKEKGKKIVYSLSLQLEGAFIGSKEAIPKDRFTYMLEVNGASTLISLARSIIISISSQSVASGQVRLPMINILKLYQEKHSTNETTIESNIQK